MVGECLHVNIVNEALSSNLVMRVIYVAYVMLCFVRYFPVGFLALKPVVDLLSQLLPCLAQFWAVDKDVYHRFGRSASAFVALSFLHLFLIPSYLGVFDPQSNESSRPI